MKLKINLLFIIVLSFFLTFCKNKTKREERIETINAEGDSIFINALVDLHFLNEDSIVKLNEDSLSDIHSKLRDSAELGLEYAKSLRSFVKSIKDRQQAIKDSSNKVLKAKFDKASEVDRQKYYNTKAGRINKKHPEWSDAACERVANNEIWIGMSIDMLRYERGNPNSANPSNYGNGVSWQWCWDDYTPSCFYSKGDGIIASYN